MSWVTSSGTVGRWHSPQPLLFDYEDLCSSFDLAVAEEYAREYDLPKTSQVVFLAMLLCDAMKLDVLCGWMIDMMEYALIEMRWNTFQAWVGRNRDRILKARLEEVDSDQDEEESSGSDGAFFSPNDAGEE